MADFVLGRIKFVWKGDWASSTAYIADDVVKYGGNAFVALVNHTSSSLFETDLSANPTKWQKMVGGIAFAGTYTNSTYYKVDDVVKYGSSLWICTTAHTAGATLDETKFTLYVPGLEFEDTWSVSTNYQSGDIVGYGGYTYVAQQQNVGVTPTDASAEWEILTTGFKNTGVHSGATAYKTGDVVRYGGNTYVNKLSHSAGAYLPTNSTYYDLLVEGISLQGDWNVATNYKIGEVVIYQQSSYRAKQDNVGQTPSTETDDWEEYNRGDPSGVFTTRGDIVVRGASIPQRLALGAPGARLVSNGTDLVYAESLIGNTFHVSPNGSDSNPGSVDLPFKTIKHALAQCKVSGVLEIDTIAGGTGGTPGTYTAVAGTGGSGQNATFDVITDGSSTPTVSIRQAGNGFAIGNTLTISGAAIGGASNITFNVTNISEGDKVQAAQGVYLESLPIVMPTKATLEGASLRGSVIKPISGNGSQIATIDTITGGTGGTPGTYNFVRQNSTTGSGTGSIFTVVTDGSSTPTVTVYHGGQGHAVNDTITILGSDVGGASNITVDVATLALNSASNMFLLNDATNIRNFTFKGGTNGMSVMSLDPNGSISSASPYIQNCTNVHTSAGVTGIKADGKAQTGGNKSILANDFTQINNDGIGVHVLNRGRTELVSVFTYYCDKAILAESGGFVRGLNSSMAYGEYGAYSDGTDPDETPITVQLRGQQLEFTGALPTGYTYAATDVARGVTSGAEADIIGYIASTKVIKIDNVVGNFQQGETVTLRKADSTEYTVTLESAGGFGDSTAANAGQRGLLFHVETSDGTLSTSGVIKVGTNLFFNGDSTAYAVTAVTEEDTANQRALLRVTSEKTDSAAEGSNATIRANYSNVRLTGHDFLDIGTGDLASTNYPNVPSQLADQGREVTEINGGRVYYTSTDQDGDFRVGDLFRVEQSTGIATLNADAFDLSGLTELQLGSIGAQIGATINEFSTDGTLSGNSDVAVPTEQAVKTYVDTNATSTGKAIAMAIVFG